MERRREIYIKIIELNKIVSMLKEIKQKEEKLAKLFEQYDSLSLEETKIFDTWGNYLEDTFTRMDHLRL